MKKLLVSIAALMLGANAFAGLTPAPDDATLNGYAEAGQNLVYAIYVEDSIKCNDIVLVGTYNSWTGDAASCSTFVAVDGFAGWYVCCVADASEDIQAKPVQLDGAGAFNWDYQVGKLEQAAVVRGTATIVPGFGDECDIKAISDAAPLLIQVNSWKNSPCTAVYHDYVITLISPDCNEVDYITPAISGSFNAWAQEAMTFDIYATYGRQQGFLPGGVFKDTVHAAEGTEYKFRSSEEWGEGWTNILRQFNTETSEWEDYNGGSNFTFGTSTEIEYDLGDPTLYSWTNCERPSGNNTKPISGCTGNIDMSVNDDLAPALGWVSGTSYPTFNFNEYITVACANSTGTNGTFYATDKVPGDWRVYQARGVEVIDTDTLYGRFWIKANKGAKITSVKFTYSTNHAKGGGLISTKSGVNLTDSIASDSVVVFEQGVDSVSFYAGTSQSAVKAQVRIQRFYITYTYESNTEPDTLDYLHFVGLSGNDTVRLDKNANVDFKELLTAKVEYSTNNRKTWNNYSWTPFEGNVAYGDTIVLNENDTVWFRAGQNGIPGRNDSLSLGGPTYYHFVFGVNDSIAAGGNTMSLLDATLMQDTMPKTGFFRLFKDAAQLASAPQLPATKLAKDCYKMMFQNCTSLQVAPALPATLLDQACYHGMFQGCSALTQVPELQSMNLALYCYHSMFENCTSLQAVPALPATLLAESCYNGMFKGCTSLVQAPELKATILADNCYARMFSGCSALEVDTCAGSCDGAELLVPSPAVAPDNWNINMFEGCHVYATPQLGGHYVIRQWQGPRDMQISASVTDVDKLYDGTPSMTQITYTVLSKVDSVMIQTDGGEWTKHTERLDSFNLGTNADTTSILMKFCAKEYKDTTIAFNVRISPRSITLTSGSDAKIFDGTPLTCDTVYITGDGFVGAEGVDFTITGSQTVVGTSDNTFTFVLQSGTNPTNYDIDKVVGRLMVGNPIKPEIIGMYDKWNIVLDKKALEDSLAVHGVTAQINPDSVRWYVVVTDADTVCLLDGSVTDDTLATRSTGLYHTEDKAMDAQYYAVICVPEAQAVLGISYFQSNVVFMTAPSAPMRDLLEGADGSQKPVKVVVDGQFIIIQGERRYNANGVEF